MKSSLTGVRHLLFYPERLSTRLSCEWSGGTRTMSFYKQKRHQTVKGRREHSHVGKWRDDNQLERR